MHQAHSASNSLSRKLARLLAVALVVAMVAGMLMLGARVARAIVSTNWAGYASKGHGHSARFGSVVGTWTQPTASCARAVTYSAFWVGLGGYSSDNTELEQTGTEADCTKSGRSLYAAWYEVLPNPPVKANLAVRPGDVIAASVTARHTGVLVRLRNLTTGRRFSKQVHMQKPFASTAEWIAEAPSECGTDGCHTLPLTNFGTVSFAGAAAELGRYGGGISSARWSALEIELEGDFAGFTASTGPTFASASPSPLTSSASAFSVTWREMSAPPPSSIERIGPPAPVGSPIANASHVRF
jgi:hypothetical protein